MPVDVIMPRVDMTMEKGTILAWKVKEGDAVQEGALLFEINTDKATMEVDAPTSGRIGGILVPAGIEVPVGTVVAQILAPGEQLARPASPSSVGSTATPGETAHGPATTASSRAPGVPTTKIRATPLARRLAQLHGIELAAAHGSGPKGRIGRADVDALLKDRSASPATRAGEVPAGEMKPQRVAFNPTRKIVAQRMLQSVQTTPHFYMSANLDMSAVVSLREQIGARTPDKARPSVTAVVVRLLGTLLPEHPCLNASVDGDAMQVHPGVHIGIAMDRDGDLLVPVIRNAQALRLAEIAAELDRLRRAARNRSIQPSELRGSTFTLSNLGMFGVDSFTAIINPGEAGILAVGRIVDTPVARKGQVALRPIATVTLSADHRIVDGAAAARFMRDLRTLVESPELAL